MSPDPSTWGYPLWINIREDDDYLHNPDPRRDRNLDRGGTIFSVRGCMNLGCLLILGLGFMTLLYVIIISYSISIGLNQTYHSAGYPVISKLKERAQSKNGGFGLGGINGTGQVHPLSTCSC